MFFKTRTTNTKSGNSVKELTRITTKASPDVPSPRPLTALVAAPEKTTVAVSYKKTNTSKTGNR